MTVERLFDTMSTEELTEWHAFYQLRAAEQERVDRMRENGMAARGF